MSVNYPLEYYQFFVHFNEGDYYTCHDLLEEIWMTDKQNLFLKGLLQMSVAIYHYEYGNVKGARMMFRKAHEYLKPFLPRYWGLDLSQTITYLEACLNTIPLIIDSVPFERVDELPKLPELFLYLDVDV
ncbi:DUF309 domain-containing protein [Pseudalkalibacillus decolorationis]|uniref:DUF309 domain-containing protein n=1 Tax=Pseudalkalibacillus decolorationis TaxID=163879 RepID=UPI0021478451|nr:DUF309 domain-containing protein [Pseudalkalibacillus decolorationis]